VLNELLHRRGGKFGGTLFYARTDVVDCSLQLVQIAMMQYQVLRALHDVLKHDIDEAAGQQARQSLKATSSDTVLVVPLPDSTPASR
jgi:hypothetical protein